MQFPNINPVAFELFGWSIHWYGIAYAAAFLLGIKYLEWLCARTEKSTGLTPKHVDSLFVWLVAGVILGGRLGYVLFYNPSFYLSNPLEIIKTWEGGMSFHGGLLGVIVMSLTFCKLNKVNFLDLADRLAPTFCIGLFLGRLANFINGELYGRVTDSPLGIIFPHGGNLPRHPSQLYEAVLEGLVLFIILHILSLKETKRGLLSGVFLLGYGTFRASVEFFREPDAHLTTGIHQYITMGQILCIPMILGGLYLILRNRKAS